MNTVGKGYLARERRIGVSFAAVLVEPDGCEVPVSLLDVSSSGFRLESNAELVIDEEVELRLPRSAPLRAKICWTRSREAGGIFLDPVEMPS